VIVLLKSLYSPSWSINSLRLWKPKFHYIFWALTWTTAQWIPHLTCRIQVEVFWTVTTCSAAVGYRRFGGSYSLHIESEGAPKSWYPNIKLYVVTTPKNSNFHRYGNLKSNWIQSTNPHPTSLGINVNIILPFMTRYLSCIERGYGLDDRGFESRQGVRIYLLTTVSRPALEPTQPLIQ